MSINVHVIEADNLEDALAKIAAIAKSSKDAAAEKAKQDEDVKKLSETRPTAHAVVTRYFSRSSSLPTRAQIEVEYTNTPPGFGIKRRRAEVLGKDYPTLAAFIAAISEEATNMQVVPGIELVGLTVKTEFE